MFFADERAFISNETKHQAGAHSNNQYAGTRNKEMPNETSEATRARQMNFRQLELQQPRADNSNQEQAGRGINQQEEAARSRNKQPTTSRNKQEQAATRTNN